MTVVAGRHVVTPDGVLDGWLRVEGGRIAELGHGPAPAADAVLDAGEGWVVPGFVDLHCHGGDGASIYAGTREDVVAVARGHLAAGTTAMFASVATMPAEAMRQAVRRIVEVVRSGEAPSIVGVHLEGPFLSPLRRGAQNGSALRRPDAALLEELLADAEDLPVIMTIAPELDGAVELIAAYADRVLFALGHSDADVVQAAAAFDAGARLVTHAFNAMPPLDHRRPGLLGAALVDQRVRIELIADGHHLHDAVLRFAATAVGPERAALVTDASAAAGLADGDHSFPDRLVSVRGSRVTLRGTDTLAGSALRLAHAHARVRGLGIDPLAAGQLASGTAAALVGLHDRGALRVGARADVVLLDQELRVQTVVHAGAVVPRSSR